MSACILGNIVILGSLRNSQKMEGKGVLRDDWRPWEHEEGRDAPFTQGTCDRMPRFIAAKQLFPSNPFLADSDYRPRKKLRRIAIALQGSTTSCHTPTHFVFTRRLHYSCFSRQNPRPEGTDGKKPYLASYSNLLRYHEMFFTMLTQEVYFSSL